MTLTLVGTWLGVPASSSSRSLCALDPHSPPTTTHTQPYGARLLPQPWDRVLAQLQHRHGCGSGEGSARGHLLIQHQLGLHSGEKHCCSCSGSLCVSQGCIEEWVSASQGAACE